MTRIAELTEETFQQGALEGAQTALVEFYAEGCAPCRALEAVLHELADEMAEQDVSFMRADSGVERMLCERFDIRSAPTTVIFRDGAPVSRLYGLKTKRQLTRALDTATDAGQPGAAGL